MKSPHSRRAILFSRLGFEIVSRLIITLRARGYEVPLLVCGPGVPDSAMPLSGLSVPGASVESVLENMDDPPAVLCLTKINILDPILMLSIQTWLWSMGSHIRFRKSFSPIGRSLSICIQLLYPAFKGPNLTFGRCFGRTSILWIV
jgi:hypothetical protein